MKEISEEAKVRFFEEVGICLKRGGFQVGPVEEGFMPVFWQEAPLCRVNGVGGVRYRSEVTRDPGSEAALNRAIDLVNVTEEYMRLLEKAPRLNATGLDESYKLLNEFNSAVLAAHHTSSQGWDFVTWCRDYSGEGVTQGHYVGGDYEGAKRDFAVRAGLVPQKELFSQEQLAEIHRCVETVRDMDFSMTVKREERMDGILEQIRRAVPDLDARIGQAQNEDGQIADHTQWSQTM